jgi:hypothetical protein
VVSVFLGGGGGNRGFNLFELETTLGSGAELVNSVALFGEVDDNVAVLGGGGGGGKGFLGRGGTLIVAVIG